MAEDWFRVGDDDVRLLRDGAEAFPAMHAAVADARREIVLEMYWVGDDACGRRFRDALVDAAKRGVRVRVIVDAVGSLALTPSFFEPLLAAGGEYLVFHPLRPLLERFDLARLERRDHRKILVVDGEVGFCGGINLARHWLPLGDGGEAWRDDAIAVRGPVATDLRAVFYATWRRVRGGHPVPRLAGHAQRPVSVVTSGGLRRRAIRNAYRRIFARATTSIDIVSSYFLPDVPIRRALFRAAARGVHVRVLLPKRSDVPLVQRASEALFERFLRRGIDLYLYPETILHAKTAVVDDRIAVIGSYNFDAQSSLKNLEANVFIKDAAFARRMRLWFEHDIAAADRLELDRWQARGALQRVTEQLSYAMRRFW